jgi:hypothetical protein
MSVRNTAVVLVGFAMSAIVLGCTTASPVDPAPNTGEKIRTQSTGTEPPSGSPSPCGCVDDSDCPAGKICVGYDQFFPGCLPFVDPTSGDAVAGACLQE